MEAILVAVVLVTAVLLYRLAVVPAMREEFERKFPPISDAEFLARCTPGTRPEVALKVRRIVADQLCVEYERVHPSMSFIEDLGAD